MSKVIASEIKNLTYFIDYLVEKEEYESFKSRVIDQILKNVEVKGFRKGFAPREMALKEVNPMMMQQTILNEMLDKYGSEAMIAGKEDLKNQGRVGMNFELDSDAETLKEDEKGFQFRLSCKLLANINTDTLIALPIDEPTEKDLADRPDYATFVESEKNRFVGRYNEYNVSEESSKMADKVTVNMSGKIDEKEDARLTANDFTFTLGTKEVLPEFEKGATGLKKGEKNEFSVTFPADYFEENLQSKQANFFVEVVNVESPKFATLTEVIEGNEEAKKQFDSEEKFDEFLKDFYDNETKKQLEQIKQKNIIKAIVEKSEDVELDEQTIEDEVNRVTLALSDQAKTTGISLAKAYIQNGLPVEDAKKVGLMDDIQVKAEVEKYVRSEFKLSQILSYIYEAKVEKKPTPQEFNQTVSQVKANPAQFNVDPKATEEQIKSIVMDRIVRQLAATWLFDQFSKKSK